mgnify:CR=1 FL=1
MLNRITTVQECDATDDDSSTTAGKQKNKTTNTNLSAIKNGCLIATVIFYISTF